MTQIPIIHHIAPFAETSDVWFLDIWGVLHNGVEPFVGCVAACEAFRDVGGTVILVSNSPRLREGVRTQLRKIGVPDTAYDAIVTSGDVSRSLIRIYSHQPVWHLGPDRDRAIFKDIDAPLAEADVAQAIICTGLFDDEHETPADYEEALQACVARNVPMVCANPDIKAQRGNRMIYCAGALAAAYEHMGGSVAYAGKPYPPIYEEAFHAAGAHRSGSVAAARVLAIGDGINTDIAGADRAGIRSIFIAGPLHLGSAEASHDATNELFAGNMAKPIAIMPALAW